MTLKDSANQGLVAALASDIGQVQSHLKQSMREALLASHAVVRSIDKLRQTVPVAKSPIVTSALSLVDALLKNSVAGLADPVSHPREVKEFSVVKQKVLVSIIDVIDREIASHETLAIRGDQATVEALHTVKKVLEAQMPTSQPQPFHYKLAK